MSRLIIIFIIGFVISGCKKENVDYNIKSPKLMESYNAWSKVRDDNNNTYRYAIIDPQPLTRDYELTEIEVENGDVVKVFITKRPMQTQTKNQIENIDIIYVSKTNELKESMSSVETIDDVYIKCDTKILSKNFELNEIQLNFYESGLLKTCGYEQQKCSSGCWTGYNISEPIF